MNGSSNSDLSPSSTLPIIVQLSTYSLVIILAIAHTILILIRPTLRNNKLNWFTINVCLTSAWFSIILLVMGVKQLLIEFHGFSCYIQTFLIDMSACQLMYAHCGFAISRLLAIVYANKPIFRSNQCLWFCIILGWLVAFLVAFPYLFLDSFLCFTSTQPIFLPYYTLITTLLLPIIIVTVCNGRTLLFVRNSTRRIHATNTGGQISHKRDVFLVKLTVGTFFSFIIGWSPSFIIQLFNKSSIVPTILNQCSQILPPLALLCDMLLLIFTNQPVRTILKQFTIKIFKC
ncbi:hypothetical protein I4U23_011131 [Adineta vaga]|nr:hypothetical protein I4U23_011131 [Adineta vaga]